MMAAVLPSWIEFDEACRAFSVFQTFGHLAYRFRVFDTIDRTWLFKLTSLICTIFTEDVSTAPPRKKSICIVEVCPSVSKEGSVFTSFAREVILKLSFANSSQATKCFELLYEALVAVKKQCFDNCWCNHTFTTVCFVDSVVLAR